VNPALTGRAYRDLKSFVPDRPGHDRRYAIDASKIDIELGWTPRRSFDEGLRATVGWYLEHADWCERILAGHYDRQRLGVTP
jgi:dTDP-glucose 4,6-dehydratase